MTASLETDEMRWRRARRNKVFFWTMTTGWGLFLLYGEMIRVRGNGWTQMFSQVGGILFFGPVAILWFLVELLVWAVWLRLITNGWGIAAPFLLAWWIYLASGESCDAPASQLLFYALLVLLIVVIIFGYIGIERVRAR